MQSEREQQARQYRGEGAEAAQTVRANAERERTVILAEAQRDAQRVRGEGDAQSTRTYGDAFGQDKQFFAFYRSLQAYRDALNGKDTAFVLSPEGSFFRFFGGVPAGIATAANATGGANAPPPAAPPPAASRSPGPPQATATVPPVGAPPGGTPSGAATAPSGPAGSPRAIAGPAPTDTVPDAPRAP
jgi:modulator of FtsH protease HflC